jgi:hypothetical protein
VNDIIKRGERIVSPGMFIERNLRERSKNEYMSTPKGMRSTAVSLQTADRVLIYSDPGQIVLQLRRQVQTEHEVLSPSYKVAVALTPIEAMSIATELLNVASVRLPRWEAPGA